MQKDDEDIRMLLKQWQVPEPRGDLAERIIARAMATAPQTVVPPSRFHSWAERFFLGSEWKAVAAALAFALVGSFALVGQEKASDSAVMAMAEQESEDVALFAEVHFESDEEWSEESIYSFL